MSLEPEGAPSPVAFEQLVEEFGDRVYGIALRITGSPPDAEDATQDAFLSAFRAWPRFRSEASPGTWLYRIAVNAALQRVRAARPVEYLVETDEEQVTVRDWRSDVPGAAERSELYAALQVGIGLLPPDVRVAVVLRDVEGLSNQEVADALGLTVPAAKSRIHRARMQLREEFQQWRDPSA